MATYLDSEIFAQIMTLPTGARRDLLGFLGQTSLTPETIEKIIDDLAVLQTQVDEKRSSNRTPDTETSRAAWSQP